MIQFRDNYRTVAHIGFCSKKLRKYLKHERGKLMRIYALKFIVAIILSMNQAHVFAQSVERIVFKGSELLYPIPKGFCNITDEIQGIMMKELIDKQKDPILPEAQSIIAPCERNISNPGYPWGWIGLMKDGPNISQETLNRMMAKILENEDLIEKFEKKMKKKVQRYLTKFLEVKRS